MTNSERSGRRPTIPGEGPGSSSRPLRAIASWAVGLALLALAACDDVTRPPVVTSLEVRPGEESIWTSERKIFNAVGIDEDGDEVSVPARWHSTNPDVAEIGAVSGTAVGMSGGATEIVATYQEMEATAQLRVDVTGTDIGPPPYETPPAGAAVP